VIAFFGVHITTWRSVLLGTITTSTSIGELLLNVRVDTWTKWNIDLVAIVMWIGATCMSNFLDKINHEHNVCNIDECIVYTHSASCDRQWTTWRFLQCYHAADCIAVNLIQRCTWCLITIEAATRRRNANTNSFNLWESYRMQIFTCEY
jgi:hypothetical protein